MQESLTLFDTNEPPFLASSPDINICTSDDGISNNKLEKPDDGGMCEPPEKGADSDPEPSDAELFLDSSPFSIFNIPDGTACRHPKYPKHLCCDGPVGRAEKTDGL
ncbi:hypothetical protein MMC31_006077 [Peltigera leucophlebia]|nr:hypothetical protein [Peltigera leucophlebia]